MRERERERGVGEINTFFGYYICIITAAVWHAIQDAEFVATTPLSLCLCLCVRQQRDAISFLFVKVSLKQPMSLQ